MKTPSFATLQERLTAIRFKEASAFQQLHAGFHPDNLKGGLMALPASTAEVSALLSCCNELGIPVVPQGGRTGLSGAAAAGADQLIVDTSMMNRVVRLDRTGGSVVVECGVTLSAVETAVNDCGLTCGIDLSARDTATVGGMVATNAGGIEAFRNGVMRHRILGLEVVLADGRVLDNLKRVTKANEGYDIKQLFVGAEGTLGIVTRVVLSLMPLRTASVTALASCRNANHAVALFRHLHNHHAIRLLSAEAMWPEYAWTVAGASALRSTLAFDGDSRSILVLLEIETGSEAEVGVVENILMALIERNRVSNIVLAKNDKERKEMWRIREDSFVVDDFYPDGFWFDVSVPLDHLSQYTETISRALHALSKDLRLFLFAHLGDGNLHATVSTGYPIAELEQEISAIMYDGLVEAGGSFSAEHGIGLEKRGALRQYVSAENRAIMQQLKQLLDPNGIMNPGKVL